MVLRSTYILFSSSMDGFGLSVFWFYISVYIRGIWNWERERERDRKGGRRKENKEKEERNGMWEIMLEIGRDRCSSHYHYPYSIIFLFIFYSNYHIIHEINFWLFFLWIPYLELSFFDYLLLKNVEIVVKTE